MDAEGRRYIDYIGSWGLDDPGPRPPGGASRRCRRPRSRASRSAPPPNARSSWPRKSSSSCPSMDQVRLVSSGTEACMSALRLARGATGRQKIVKFEGCYHGHADFAAREGRLRPRHVRPPDQRRRAARGGAAHARARVQQPSARSRRPSRAHGRQIACVVIEPIAGNMNFVRASVPFMKRVPRAVRLSTARCWCSTRS